MASSLLRDGEGRSTPPSYFVPMPDPLHTKVQDFVQWSVLALQRNAAGDHPDALNNMRKAAEAACKVLSFRGIS